ncbi:MAG TPA: hypothetical protein VOA80_21295 [Thermoanaerobaculia bacterium]|nr:hypothetical protein [Thermoanaerobaculia bacterium]
MERWWQGRWCIRRLALAAFLLSLIAGLPLTAVRTLRRVGRATLSLGEDARGARVRLLGAATVAALDSIRHAIPEDGEYLLVDGGEELQAEAYWVRFELAPRRAVFLGRLSEMERAPRLSWKLPPAARGVVVAYPGGPSRLLSGREFLELLEAKRGPG